MKILDPEAQSGAQAAFSEDDLLQLEIQVAQRADILARQTERVADKDMSHWLQAEREIFAQRSSIDRDRL